jgi:tetratricopeptide (TPR) repeat protein
VGEMVKARHKGSPPTESLEDLMAKGQEALERGDLQAAERHFGQATVVRPSSPEAWYGKGRAFSLQEEWEKALRCFSIATKFNPEFGNAWAGLAACHLHLDDKEKAREALLKAQENGADPPRLLEIRNALA